MRRQVNGIMRSYTQKDIEDWQGELINIPKKMQDDKNTIESSQQQLNILEPQLNKLITEELKPALEKISGLDARIKELTLPSQIQNIKSEIIPHQIKIDALLPELNQEQSILAPINNEIFRLSTLIEMADLQQTTIFKNQEIYANQSAITSLEIERQSLEMKYSEMSNRINSIQYELSSLETQQIFDSTAHYEPIGHEYHNSPGMHHPHHDHGPIVGGIHTVIDVTRDLRIGQLRSELYDYSNQRSVIDAQQHHVVNEISNRRDTISHLERDIANLNSRINALGMQVGGFSSTNDASQLQWKLQQQRDLKAPHEERKNFLEREINAHAASKNNLQDKINNLDKLYEKSVRLSVKYKQDNDVSDLASRLKQQNDIEQRLQTEKNRLENLISNHKDTINSRIMDIQTLENRQKNLNNNQYLKTLLSNPEVLFNQLIASIHEKFAEYELNHPAGQHILVRACLAETEHKMNLIGNSHIENNLDQRVFAEMNPMRCKYYQLTGLLQDMRFRISNVDADFTACIDRMLSPENVDAVEAKYEYRKLQYMFPKELRDSTDNDIFVYESQQFDTIKNNFRNALMQQPTNAPEEIKSFYKKGWDVLDAIDAQQKSAQKKGIEFDTKYHSSLLNVSHKLLVNPGEQHVIDEFKLLASHNKDGKSSLGKKIGGALMMFLGAGIVVASVVLGVATLGFSSPVTITGLVAGSALSASGLGLFVNGRKKGLDKKLDCFSNDSVKAREVFQLWHQPQQPVFVTNAQVYQAPVMEQVMPIILPIPSAPPLDESVSAVKFN